MYTDALGDHADYPRPFWIPERVTDFDAWLEHIKLLTANSIQKTFTCLATRNSGNVGTVVIAPIDFLDE